LLAKRMFTAILSLLTAILFLCIVLWCFLIGQAVSSRAERVCGGWRLSRSSTECGLR
jgi:hypothetical protein